MTKIMKRIFLICLGGLLLAGCSRDTLRNNAGGNADGNVAARWMSFDLVSAGGIGTRAEEGEYENGTDSENAVKMVRFFFFDAEGNASGVWKRKGTGGADSWLDFYPTTEDVADADGALTVEKIVHTTLGLTVKESAFPALVMAVVNPTPAILALEETVSGEDDGAVYGPSLAELRAVVSDFLSGRTEGNFVMSNSVFVSSNDGSGVLVDAEPLRAENFAESPEAAALHPVTVFVERVVARLDLVVALEGGINSENGVIYPANNKNGKGYPVINDDGSSVTAEQEIYVELLGWNVTGTTDKSRLVKKIDPSWKTTDFDGFLWNSDNYHRSFWALNPPAGTFGYRYGTFAGEADPARGNWNPAGAYPIPAAKESATVYLQENAGLSESDLSVENPSKVIIAARLTDKNGKTLPLAEWNYQKYTLTGLKNRFANEVLNLYKKTEEADGSVRFDKIAPADLDFKTGSQLYGEADPDDSHRYYVYAVLSEAAEAFVWTLGEDKEAVMPSVDAVNRYIRDRVNHVMVWNEGLTYYYFDIRHLGAETAKDRPGYVGVVRNHIYRATVSGLNGLGTPVYDPDHEVIYPEKTEYDESILSAEVKVLQWRIVSQEYFLEW